MCPPQHHVLNTSDAAVGEWGCIERSSQLSRGGSVRRDLSGDVRKAAEATKRCDGEGLTFGAFVDLSALFAVAKMRRAESGGGRR